MKKLLLALVSLVIVSHLSGAGLLERVEAEYKLNGLNVSAFGNRYSLDCDLKVARADSGVRIYLKVSGVKRYEDGRVMHDPQFVNLSYSYRASPSGDGLVDQPLAAGVGGKGDEGVGVWGRLVHFDDDHVFLLVISTGSGPSSNDLRNELKAGEEGASRIVTESGVTILRLITFSTEELNQFWKLSNRPLQ